MIDRFLLTKFHIPSWQSSAVPRPRLVQKLQSGLKESRKLSLIAAGAGYGKTTLVAEWIHAVHSEQAVDERFAFLSLDPADNAPARFLGYFIAAFQQLEPTLGQGARMMLDGEQTPPLIVVLDDLINDLTVVENQLVLVLDDYHLIDKREIHTALEYFLDHQPAQIHLVLTTRSDPNLPLARLRVRNQMTEIRAHDLRFTLDEAGAFFNQTMKLDLGSENIDALEARTEGWAAGLQLAALALQNLPDPQEFINTFRGSHRYVLDYLAEEVLRQQEKDVRHFLTQISILDRFNASICEALTGYSNCQIILEYLEQGNLFIISLDNERIWYRFHHLFSDYLRTLLNQSEQIDLLKKASTWHAGNHLMVEAVRYALASTDSEFSAGIIDQALKDDAIWSGGNLALLSSWLDALPSQAIQARPQLCLNAARILYLSGRFELAEERIRQTEQSLKSLPSTSETEQMFALASLYRGSIASVRGEVKEAIEQISFAQARLPKVKHLAHARAYFGLGLAYEISDQTQRAVDNYLGSSQEAQSAGVLFLAVHALCAAAQLQIKQARLSLAEQTCHQAIQLVGENHIPPIGLAFSILGAIALERNDLTAADQLLQDGIALSRQGGLSDDVVLGVSFLAHLYAVQGDSIRASEAIQEAETIIQSYGIPRMSVLVSAYLARFQFYTGQKQEALQWAARYQSIRSESQGEYEDLTLARILLSTGELETIPSILHPLLEKADQAGRMRTCIEIMLLLGLFYHTKQDTESALDWCRKSLHLAAPEGFIRIFLDEGELLKNLVPKARQAAPEFVDRLLRSFQPSANSILPSLNQQLPDPLSQQELRVLKLVIAGMSNREIAEELVISVGTAKWHVHNILQKLGVSNRPQAIARARELGIT